MRPMVFIFIAFVSVMAVAGVSKWWMPKELVSWQTDLAAARTQAQASNRPMLVYFTAEWCGPCQGMRRHVWTDPRVADAMAAYVPVRIDVDVHPDIARRFNIEAMPTFVVLDAQQQVVRQSTGAMEAADMETWLKTASTP
jgi:protein disulfide-isomerase